MGREVRRHELSDMMEGRVMYRRGKVEINM